MKLFIRLLVCLCLSFALIRSSAADDVYQIIVKKQETKKSTRWSLAEWLETKNRIKLMDMWLALHTPSPFEFYVGGNYQFASRDGTPYNGGQGHLAAYATIFGLEAQIEQSSARIYNGLFHVRLFGYHTQTTNITIHGGLRSRDGEFRSPVAGVSSAIYFTRFFGIDGLYRRIFSSNTGDRGYSINGHRYEAGAFIDFKWFRVYGQYFHEQEFANSPSLPAPARKGAATGVRLFF